MTIEREAMKEALLASWARRTHELYHRCFTAKSVNPHKALAAIQMVLEGEVHIDRERTLAYMRKQLEGADISNDLRESDFSLDLDRFDPDGCCFHKLNRGPLVTDRIIAALQAKGYVPVAYERLLAAFAENPQWASPGSYVSLVSYVGTYRGKEHEVFGAVNVDTDRSMKLNLCRGWGRTMWNTHSVSFAVKKVD